MFPIRPGCSIQLISITVYLTCFMLSSLTGWKVLWNNNPVPVSKWICETKGRVLCPCRRSLETAAIGNGLGWINHRSKTSVPQNTVPSMNHWGQRILTAGELREQGPSWRGTEQPLASAGYWRSCNWSYCHVKWSLMVSSSQSRFDWKPVTWNCGHYLTRPYWFSCSSGSRQMVIAS